MECGNRSFLSAQLQQPTCLCSSVLFLWHVCRVGLLTLLKQGCYSHALYKMNCEDKKTLCGVWSTEKQTHAGQQDYRSQFIAMLVQTTGDSEVTQFICYSMT